MTNGYLYEKRRKVADECIKEYSKTKEGSFSEVWEAKNWEE